MPKISIIIPVYNAEKHIEKCLDSLMIQTIKEKIEIIIINDGSTDNSEKVIKGYIEKHGVDKIKSTWFFLINWLMKIGIFCSSSFARTTVLPDSKAVKFSTINISKATVLVLKK